MNNVDQASGGQASGMPASGRLATGWRIARRCERAVVNAYAELRQRGSDDMSAFVACTALLYRIHHPEASLNEARRLVAEWVDQHLDRSTGDARSRA